MSAPCVRPVVRLDKTSDTRVRFLLYIAVDAAFAYTKHTTTYTWPPTNTGRHKEKKTKQPRQVSLLPKAQ